MTVEELMVEVFEGAGEPTDLWIYDDSDDFDIDLEGSVRLLAFLNRAYQRLANWKLPNGTNIRFASLNRRLTFQVNHFDLLVGDSVTPTASLVPLDATRNTTDGHYEQWTAEIASERRVIISYDGTSLVPHKAFTSAPSTGDAVVLSKRFFKFVEDVSGLHTGEAIEVSPQEVVAVQSIWNLTDDMRIERMNRTEEFWSRMVDAETSPGLFAQIDEGIEFDSIPVDGTSFLMRYYGAPEALTAADQVPKIPEAWHEPLLYLAIWITMKRDRATDEAYSLKRDIQEMIAQTVQQSERSFEFEDGGLYIKE